MSETPETYHYFAACAIGWATAPTAAEALAKIAKEEDTVFFARHLKRGGLYAWTCRVLLPASAAYTIEFYAPCKQPDGTPVPRDNAEHWRVLNRQGTAIGVSSNAAIVNALPTR